MGNEVTRRAFPGSLEVVGDRCESREECTQQREHHEQRGLGRRVTKAGERGSWEMSQAKELGLRWWAVGSHGGCVSWRGHVLEGSEF